MEKLVKIQKILIAFLTVVIVGCCLTYKYNLSAVGKESKLIEIEITENETLYSVSKVLKEKNLIHSEFFYKLYVKLMKKDGLQIGVYQLSNNMDVEKIVEVLTGAAKSKTEKIVIHEGDNVRDIIKSITAITKLTESDFIDTLSNQEYLDELIKKYWFLTDDIKNEKIYYSLEGYLYPNTYEIDPKFSVKQILEIFLKETNLKLEKYKTKMENNEYSIHEIMTMASIIELEGANSLDRAGIAGVFYNRLNAGWSLGSDVTTYYGLKLDMSERDLYQKELDEYNAYNTRSAKMAGKLPVGPICNPSIDSIQAATTPEKSNNFYFVADKNKKTYFSKKYSEHVAQVNKLKAQNLWYEY